MKILSSMKRVAGLARAFLIAAAQKVFESKTTPVVLAEPARSRKHRPSNQVFREEHGIRGGVPGAKLRRKAAQGQLGMMGSR